MFSPHYEKAQQKTYDVIKRQSKPHGECSQQFNANIMHDDDTFHIKVS
jgi:hypothetical protein